MPRDSAPRSRVTLKQSLDVMELMVDASHSIMTRWENHVSAETRAEVMKEIHDVGLTFLLKAGRRPVPKPRA